MTTQSTIELLVQLNDLGYDLDLIKNLDTWVINGKDKQGEPVYKEGTLKDIFNYLIKYMRKEIRA